MQTVPGEWIAEESEYKSAPSLYGSSMGCIVCQWCGKTNIRETFTATHHGKRWSLQVGSECIRHISGGASGLEMRKEEQWASNRGFLKSFEVLRRDLFNEFSELRSVGYGRRERKWFSREAYVVYQAMVKLSGQTCAEHRNPDMVSPNSAITRWISRNQEKATHLIVGAKELREDRRLAMNASHER